MHSEEKEKAAIAAWRARVRAERLKPPRTRPGPAPRGPYCGKSIAPLSAADEAKFWSRVPGRGRPGCWYFYRLTGRPSPYRQEYGAIPLSIGVRRAHRVAWVVGNRTELPGWMVVRHLCAEPRCVRPDHLAAGTQTDNMLDRGRVASLRAHLATLDAPSEPTLATG
jgi:hypothetical protein